MEQISESQLSSKPRLLCIEGPAGIGKTTLCGVLIQRLRAAGLAYIAVDEFSRTPLGQELCIRLSRSSCLATTWSAMETMMLCVADKFTSISIASRADSEFVLLDRGFITQYALALPYITNPADKAHAEAIIDHLNRWLVTQFDVTTLLLQLPNSFNILRLEKRLERDIKEDERRRLLCEIEAYADLKARPITSILGLRMLSALADPDDLADAVMTAFIKSEGRI